MAKSFQNATQYPSETSQPTRQPTPKRSSQPKRSQVPKACSNCRRMHAACDIERPCRRCVQGGLSDSCIDVPRKKRVSKKRKNEESVNPPQEGSNSSWDDTLRDFLQYQEMRQNSPSHPSTGSTPILSPSQALELYNPLNYQTEGSLQELQNYTLSPSSSLTPPPSTPNSNSFFDLSFLMQQITELKDSNKALENKLHGVSQELLDMRTETKMVGQLTSNVMSGWHSFMPQSELAISVWRPLDRGGTVPLANVLMECNDKFVNLMGYPMEVLRNNFLCSNMMCRTEEASDDKSLNCRDWPKRTQITTAQGSKEVFITITPIQDGKNKTSAKYYLMYILEVN